MLVDLHLQGRLPLEKFVSETIALDDVEAAFEKMHQRRRAALGGGLLMPRPGRPRRHLGDVLPRRRHLGRRQQRLDRGRRARGARRRRRARRRARSPPRSATGGWSPWCARTRHDDHVNRAPAAGRPVRRADPAAPGRGAAVGDDAPGPHARPASWPTATCSPRAGSSCGCCPRPATPPARPASTRPELGTVFTGDTLFQGGPGATGRSFSSLRHDHRLDPASGCSRCPATRPSAPATATRRRSGPSCRTWRSGSTAARDRGFGTGSRTRSGSRSRFVDHARGDERGAPADPHSGTGNRITSGSRSRSLIMRRVHRRARSNPVSGRGAAPDPVARPVRRSCVVSRPGPVLIGVRDRSRARPVPVLVRIMRRAHVRPGRHTRRSVTTAVTRSAGVTSKAGLPPTPAGATAGRRPQHLVRARAPRSRSPRRRVSRVHGRLRRGDDERDAGPGRGQRQRVCADLVGDVAVGGDPVGADDDGVDQPAGDDRRPGAVDDHAVRRRPARPARRRDPGALQQRTGLVGDHVRDPAGLVQRRGPRRARCPTPRRPARRRCSACAAAAAPIRTARRAGRRPRSRSPGRRRRPRRGPRARRPAPRPARPAAAASARRTPTARFTAVGRAAASRCRGRVQLGPGRRPGRQRDPERAGRPERRGARGPRAAGSRRRARRRCRARPPAPIRQRGLVDDGDRPSAQAIVGGSTARRPTRRPGTP